MRKTKIICTLGPATDGDHVLRDMILAGMNVARLNFSHGTHDEHKARADKVKRLREELGRPVALMIDTKGPDIRVGRIRHNFVELKTGNRFALCAQPCEGNEEQVSVTYPALAEKLNPGDIIMLDDGLIKLSVTELRGVDVVCRVENGGVLSNNKSVNVPGVKLDIPYIREKDIEDIHFAIDNDFDFIAASFVRSAQDVWDIRQVLEQRAATGIQIIAKIENSEGIDNIDEILDISNSIMIARGDMGVELPFEHLPAIQKLLIKKARAKGRRSITATQMLESMIRSPRPTRAEISDVANAIYDGTSAIMLSGETSVGEHPVEVVRTMCRIAETTEADIDYPKRFRNFPRDGARNTTDAVSHAAVTMACDLPTDAIITLSQSGHTADLVTRYLPPCPTLCFTPDPKVYHQLALTWGCQPMKLPFMDTSDDLFNAAMTLAGDTGLVRQRDRVVFTAGLPLGKSGCTNYLRVGIIGQPEE